VNRTFGKLISLIVTAALVAVLVLIVLPGEHAQPAPSPTPTPSATPPVSPNTPDNPDDPETSSAPPTETPPPSDFTHYATVIAPDGTAASVGLSNDFSPGTVGGVAVNLYTAGTVDPDEPVYISLTFRSGEAALTAPAALEWWCMLNAVPSSTDFEETTLGGAAAYFLSRTNDHYTAEAWLIPHNDKHFEVMIAFSTPEERAALIKAVESFAIS
jgi:hypothetical protein